MFPPPPGGPEAKKVFLHSPSRFCIESPTFRFTACFGLQPWSTPAHVKGRSQSPELLRILSVRIWLRICPSNQEFVRWHEANRSTTALLEDLMHNCVLQGTGQMPLSVNLITLHIHKWNYERCSVGVWGEEENSACRCKKRPIGLEGFCHGVPAMRHFWKKPTRKKIFFS